jgi:hypothetical protein
MSPARASSAGLALVLMTGCVEGGADEATVEALRSALASAAGAGTQVDLAAVVGGEWTRLVFVCPYEDRGVVEDRLGFAWNGFPGQDDTEGLATYVFASTEEVTTWVRVGRNEGDPCSSSSIPRVVPRPAARFVLEQTETTADGRPFYSLVQRP